MLLCVGFGHCLVMLDKTWPNKTDSKLYIYRDDNNNNNQFRNKKRQRNTNTKLSRYKTTRIGHDTPTSYIQITRICFYWLYQSNSEYESSSTVFNYMWSIITMCGFPLCDDVFIKIVWYISLFTSNWLNCTCILVEAVNLNI